MLPLEGCFPPYSLRHCMRPRPPLDLDLQATEVRLGNVLDLVVNFPVPFAAILLLILSSSSLSLSLSLSGLLRGA